ncbi:DUF58 domain-containing protein [Kineosporia babensis]|uniref:DUF58 domain-containing protein n=1 Tax=Kineosporia babensis TaxID=499548 RepID=A0A9X1NA07_9ACTN|nr:DUF58 domain-containing protein [Kineosporia babensis]MCD5309904.1 DUF58 domain-containing protein [Kineosporia babensis]
MGILRPITPGGWLAIMLAAVLAAIAVRALNPWLLLVAFALFVPVVLSQVMRPDLKSVSVAFRSPERMVVDEPVEQLLTVRNDGKRLLPGFAILHECKGLAPIHLAVPPLAPGDHVRLAFPRRPVHRGQAEIHEVHLYALAPFGMASHSRRIRGRAEIVVHPARVPGVELESGRRSIEDAVGARLLPPGSEPHGLREWRHGDERRHVNWRATARQAALGQPGRLIVVVQEPEVEVRLVLAITGSPQDEDWEELLALAAWSACAAVASHADVTLLAPGVPAWTGTDEQLILDWFSSLNSANAEPPDEAAIREFREAVQTARRAPGKVVVEASTIPFGLQRIGPA